MFSGLKAALGAAACIMVVGTTVATSNVPPAPNRMSVEEVAERTMPSIARVIVSLVVKDVLGNNETFESRGTAFVIDGKGHLLTNNHVISADDGKTLVSRTVRIQFSDDPTLYDAHVVGADAPSDLAVLLVREIAGKRKALAFADWRRLKIGQEVVAIGYAKDFLLEGTPTVSRGIVSAVGRSFNGMTSGLVQTDATINSGNSGGPLLDMAGEVVGVNTFNITNTINLNFARGAGTAEHFARRMIEQGEVYRPDLGLKPKKMAGVMLDSLRLPKRGVLVTEVAPDSPASRAGIRANDIVYAIEWPDGSVYEVPDVGALNDALAFVKPGEMVRLHFLRLSDEGIRFLKQGTPVESAMITWLHARFAAPTMPTGPKVSHLMRTPPALPIAA